MILSRSIHKLCLSALTLGALLAARSGQAQRYVDLPGTQPGGLESGSPLDSANTCSSACHSSSDPDTPAVTPFDTWIGSMMGNTMRDPLYLAALTVAEQDAPGVGDYCLRCHTPPGFLGGRTRGTPTASNGSALTPGDREGVTCDSCHRMLPTTNRGNGQYELSLTETRFGPYPVIDSIRHPGEQSTYLAESRMCATCHDITNPLSPQLRADGSDTGNRFPLDTTYGEWANSVFAIAGTTGSRTCQDCHMPRIEGQGRVATTSTAVLRDRPRRHDFAGANVWALGVLGRLRNEIASGEFYDPTAVPYYEAGARRAEAMLRSAVTLQIREAPTTAAPGASVSLVVRLTNRAGHRVPTGYADGRRMWLTVDLLDADGQTTVISGRYDTETATLDETDTQLRLYEALHGRAGMGRSEHIALHNTVVRDSRLPPEGYRPAPGHEPVGVDFSGGANGTLRHWDDARYTVTIPATARGTLTLRVRARYQSTTREYVEFLARENHTDARGSELLRLYNASGRAAPTDMVEASAQLAIDRPDVSATDASADATADDADPGNDARLDEGTQPPPSCGRCGVGNLQQPGPARSLAALALIAGAIRRRRLGKVGRPSRARSR